MFGAHGKMSFDFMTLYSSNLFTFFWARTGKIRGGRSAATCVAVKNEMRDTPAHGERLTTTCVCVTDENGSQHLTKTFLRSGVFLILKKIVYEK